MNKHYCLCREELWNGSESPSPDECHALRNQVEPWLASLMQSEHLCLLLGSGLTIGVAHALGVDAPGMGLDDLGTDFDEQLRKAATDTAGSARRGDPNLEDLLRCTRALAEGLAIQGDERVDSVQQAYRERLAQLVRDVLTAEEAIATKIADENAGDESGLFSLLLSAASRPPSQERLELFTTNYDRLVETVCDRIGLRLVDRFVGTLEPRFRSSRLTVDLHYDPPGIRGEPRYLEGVVRFTKLHGSLDWRERSSQVRRVALPFGADAGHPEVSGPGESVLIYPNPAKDIETTGFPYADLFRDLSASLCRPNTVLMTYGYGFGDDHINRVIRDMLTLSSTHLVIVSFDDPGATATGPGRIGQFVNAVGSNDQVSVLLGSHFGSLPTFTGTYLPRSLSESLRRREARVRAARGDVNTTGEAVGDDAQGAGHADAT